MWFHSAGYIVAVYSASLVLALFVYCIIVLRALWKLLMCWNVLPYFRSHEICRFDVDRIHSIYTTPIEII